MDSSLSSSNFNDLECSHEYTVCKTICSSLSAVIYLTTDPPTSQQKAIRPISLISENDDDPYWKNHIEKYFNHPEEEEFTNLTYPEYFKNYEITITQLTIKFRHLKLHDEQLFFYQKLLLELPCKIEEELFGKFLTYQEHCNILGPKNQKNKYPYFFITGSAGTGKSFIINLITDHLKNKHSNYLLLTPTGIAATNIGAFNDYDFLKFLKTIDTLIIDEISMVSNALFSFISDMFSIIQQQTIAFGGLNVIVVGDLAQLPSVTGLPVYKSLEWKLFYPLFLKQPQRQIQD
ncbi:AAA family ATPase [Rhizophagus clarus]|uniref:AAA family ATPase n=1 Tax=Rhizophagus clarus TaxID=94130 RepID=A0A8H3M5R0_9GLOM|nr:AAA family ATPase [Rhizophagus clarus]